MPRKIYVCDEDCDDCPLGDVDCSDAKKITKQIYIRDGTTGDVNEAEELLADVVNQACALSDGTLDSMALSSFADAMRYLAKLGVFQIKREAGKRVIGVWRKKE